MVEGPFYNPARLGFMIFVGGLWGGLCGEILGRCLDFIQNFRMLLRICVYEQLWLGGGC